MKMRHRITILASIGFGMGVIFGVMITAFSATLTYGDGTLHLCSEGLIKAVGDPLTAFTIQAFASGLHGALALGSSAIYEYEKWSLVKVTFIHYITVMISFYTLAFLMRWFVPDEPKEPVIMFFIMTGVYFVIWLSNYISYRAELKKLNRELDEYKSSAEGMKSAGI